MLRSLSAGGVIFQTKCSFSSRWFSRDTNIETPTRIHVIVPILMITWTHFSQNINEVLCCLEVSIQSRSISVQG